MTDLDKDDIALDALFATARDLHPKPGADLMARILADAAAQTKAHTAPTPVTALPPARSGWAGILAAIGGWPAMGGMAIATVAGIWIGVAPPAGLSTLAGGLWGETVSVQLYADNDPFGLLEG